MVGTITTASNNTVAAGSVISESPVAGTQVATASSVNLVISSGSAAVPKVVSVSVLFGSQSYNVTGFVARSVCHGNSRAFAWSFGAHHFGRPASLTGCRNWHHGTRYEYADVDDQPDPIGIFYRPFSGSGANALKDAGGQCAYPARDLLRRSKSCGAISTMMAL